MDACGGSTARTRKPENLDLGLVSVHVWVDILSKKRLSMR